MKTQRQLGQLRLGSRYGGLLVLALLMACSSNNETPNSSDQAVINDASISPGDQSSITQDKSTASDQSNTVGWSFQSEDDGQNGAALALELESIEGDNAWLNVVGRGISELQGVAFRLKYDPAQMSYLKSELGGAWSNAGGKVTNRFFARKDGQLWVGIGFVGVRSIVVTSKKVLAKIQVQLLKKEPITLQFQTGHTAVIDTKAQTSKPNHFAGTFSYQKAATK